ncbi:hypothetical protein CIG1485E_a0064 (plasmid) [Campylobacter iguaniorum]|uniref:30S ribosomal protein S1 n=1 Tax=Campylobacter iguaniorum TaxID=1244531 RepID=A0A076FI95_9BACT|nr:hypothetical protein [Campylobacter iguaniorum]AII15589.1 hypothetical protein CIG1485E_a0064 [Campylobacter iguaniorum]
MTILDVLDEVSRQYDVDSYTIVRCLKRAVRDELGLGEVFDNYKDGKLDFYEVFVDRNNRQKQRRVKITQKRLNYVRDRLYRYIIEENTQERLEAIKGTLENDKVVRGKIVSKTDYGLEVSTRYGKAFAPMNLLNPKELEEGRYKIGIDLNFHIHKLGIKKNKINIVLDRVSKFLTEHIIKEVLGNRYTIYTMQRMFGKRIKIYIDREPSQEERELLSMSLDEKVKFKLM